MQILIPLPECSKANTYQELKSYLKQLELAVHHAQKSVESAEKEGIELSESAFIGFKHPKLEKVDNMKDFSEEALKEFEYTFFEELQYIQLNIVLE